MLRLVSLDRDGQDAQTIAFRRPASTSDEITFKASWWPCLVCNGNIHTHDSGSMVCASIASHSAGYR